jgi:hypothetical protein
MAFEPRIFDLPKFNDLPSAWTEHFAFAYYLIQKVKPTVFVELGTHAGGSYFNFCQAIKELELPTKAFAVDTWLGDEHAGYYGSEVFTNVNRINKENFGGFSSLIRSTFDEAAQLFEDEHIDLLHIDGLHTYEAVRHDFYTWLPKMSRRGIIVFHDTVVRERGFGVWQLIEELRPQYPYFEFEHGYGLGILAVGKEVGQDILALLEEGKDEFTNSLFAAIGRKNLLEFENKRQEEYIGKLLGEIERYRDNTTQYQDQKLQLQKKVDVLQKLAEAQETQIKEVKIHYEDASNRLASLEQNRPSFRHFLYGKAYSGFKRGKSVIKKMLGIQNRYLRILTRSGLFDASYYKAHNPDVAASNISPLLHFLNYGGQEGRNPSAEFDASFYLKTNPDVQLSGMNPLLHFLIYGQKEGRAIKQLDPVFSSNGSFQADEFEVIHLKEKVSMTIHSPLKLQTLIINGNKTKPLINKYFERIYVFYHPNRRQKFVDIVNRLKAWNIEAEMVEMVDGYTFPYIQDYEHYQRLVTEWSVTEISNLHQFTPRIDSPEAWAQLLSNRLVLIDALTKGYKRILLVEEHFLLMNDFHREFETFAHTLAEKEWKFLFLGVVQENWSVSDAIQCANPNHSVFEDDQPYYHPIVTNGSFAMGIDRSQYKDLIDKIEEWKCPFESLYSVFFGHLWQEGIVAFPNLIIEDIVAKNGWDEDAFYNGIAALKQRRWDLLKYEKSKSRI